MMSDLVKKSDVIDEIMHIIPYKCYHNGKYVILLDKKECLKVIKAVPARHEGEWIKTTPWSYDGSIGDVYGYYQKCSNCGKEFMDKSNYCPNCGARMEGVKDDN